MKKKKTRLPLLVLAVMLIVTSLSGCSRDFVRSILLSRKSVRQEESSSRETQFETSQPETESLSEEFRDEVPGETGSESAGLELEDMEVPSSEPSRYSTVRERIERAKEWK